MKKANIYLKNLLFKSSAAILVTSLIAILIIIPVFADDAGFTLRFDGTNDNVDLPETDNIFNGDWTTTKSVALWVKPNGWQTDCNDPAVVNPVAECDSIFGDRPTFWGITIGRQVEIDQNKIWVWNYDNTAPSNLDSIGVEYTPGEWTHIALVHNNGMLRAYKNGILVGSTPSGPTQLPPGGGNRLTLGGVVMNQQNQWRFNGDIDEVSIWDRALSADEISANMYQDTPTNSADLAAFYRMSNGFGTSLTDNSGNGHTGTLIGPPAWVDSTAFDVTGPSVSINQASGQADPTSLSPINFQVIFGEAVTGFATGDVSLSGTAGANTAIVTGSGTTYNVAVSGMTNTGIVIASINTGVAHNSFGEPNQPSTSTDNTVQFNVAGGGPTATINQAIGQSDPTSTSPINFQVIFSQSVTGFATGDVSLSGTAGASTAVVTGSGTTYNVAVRGMNREGTVIATVPPGVAQNTGGTPNAASTSSDNTVTYIDNTGPTVTINQAPGQRDPAPTLPVHFQVIFSEAVEDFSTSDVNLTGTSALGPRFVEVNGSGTTYDVGVSGFTNAGLVIATINAGVVTDASGNPNSASTSTDKSILYINAPFSVYLPLTRR